MITGISQGGGGAAVLEISKNEATPENFDFMWNSTEGKLYDLLSSTDLSTSPDTWPVWRGIEDIPADETGTNVIFDLPGGVEAGDPRRYFSIRERKP